MTVNAPHGVPRRSAAAFLPAARCPAARCPTTPATVVRRVTTAASGGFHPDSGGASSPTDATAAPVSVSPAASRAPASGSVMPYFVAIISHLRDRASSLAHHLHAEQPSFIVNLSLGQSPFGPTRSAITAADHSVDPSMRPLPLHRVPPSVSPRTSGQHYMQQELQQQQDDGHLWTDPSLAHLPWSYGERTTQSHSHDAAAAGASHHTAAPEATTTTAAAARRTNSLPPLLLPPSLGSLHSVLTARAAGLLLLWHTAVSLQQRAVAATLWRVGQAVEAAEQVRRRIPAAQDVPALVQWSAANAAAHAEESVALVLAHTATAASAAAAGVPAATAAVTGSAVAVAAAAAVAAPHLPLLRHSRRRTLAAAMPLLERLRGVQRGCTTHVLLRFLLFSSVNPRLRRDLLTRLDVLARRAAQLAILQEQHDAWAARQPPPFHPAASTPRPPHSHPTGPTAASAPSAIHTTGVSPLTARWYRSVFASEMQACARQLRCEAPGSKPDDRTAGDPPGRFDLRDLYRLIRVLEVAVEDLERYQ